MSDSEQELVRRCQAARGPAFEEAFRELYALYKNRVYTVCLRVTANTEDAMDAAQETMVTLARRIGDFGFRSRFSSWVYRIAVNSAIDVRRKRLAGPRGSVVTVLASGDSDLLADKPAPAEISDPVERTAGTESQEMVRAALQKINPRFAALLTLRYVEGLSYEQIAEIDDCNLGTVKSRLNRAHTALRDYLSQRGLAVLDEN